MSEAHRIEYVATEEMAEPAVRAFMAAKRLGAPPTLSERLWRWGLMIVVVGCTAYFWVMTGTNWISIAGTVVALLLVLVLGWDRWFCSRLRSGFLDSVRELGGTPVACTLRDDALVLQSAIGSREVSWANIRGLYCGHGFWVLSEASRPATMIPESSLTESFERVLLERARAAGVEVRREATGVEADYDDGPANTR
jgi:hypothetical protein